MKRIYLIFFLAFLMTAAGCRERPRELSSAADTTSKTESSNSIYDASPEISGAETQEAENSKGSLTSENSSVTQSRKQSENKNSQAEAPNNAPEVENPSSESIQNAESSVSEAETPATPPKPAVKDEIWIANRVFELLNEERKAAGVHTREMLSGLNKVAVLRSEQLVTQFSHKWIDEYGNEWSGAQYASTVLKYGKKEQSSIYDPDTGTVTPIDEYYYDYGGTENCYYGGTAVRPKSEIAESIVNSFKGSQSHWSSLMSSSMFYDGIGITFCNGMVYCSVNSSAENYG